MGRRNTRNHHVNINVRLVDAVSHCQVDVTSKLTQFGKCGRFITRKWPCLTEHGDMH